MQNNKRIQAILLLLTRTIFLSSSAPVIKQLVSIVSPSTHLAMRFIIATVVLLPFATNLNKRLLRDGALGGLFLFGIYGPESLGLQSISANRAVFILGMTVVLVTLFKLIFRGKISARVLTASFMTFFGIGVMSWQSGEPFMGDIWLFVSVLCDVAYILTLESSAGKHRPIQLAMVQFAVVAILGTLWAGPNMIGELDGIRSNIGMFLYVGIAATVIAIWCQTRGQQWISAQESSIFYGVEPIFAAFFSYWLLGETLSPKDLLGGAMIITGIILVLTSPTTVEES